LKVPVLLDRIAGRESLHQELAEAADPFAPFEEVEVLQGQDTDVVVDDVAAAAYSEMAFDHPMLSVDLDNSHSPSCYCYPLSESCQLLGPHSVPEEHEAVAAVAYQRTLKT
jgi:hypothetical protein